MPVSAAEADGDSSITRRLIQWVVSSDHALSVITLNWMLEAANSEGLPLKPGWRLTATSLASLSQKGIIHASESYGKFRCVLGDRQPTAALIGALPSIFYSQRCDSSDSARN